MSQNTTTLNQLLDRDLEFLSKRIYLLEQNYKTASLIEKQKIKKDIDDLKYKVKQAKSQRICCNPAYNK